MQTPSKVLVLSNFNLTRDEIRVKTIDIGKDILTINPNADFYWNMGTTPSYSKLSDIASVFNQLELRGIDTLICNVCDDNTDIVYTYIRELARVCEIQVITAKELHEIAKEY